MSKDISNKAVVILAVLTIVISALGTFTVLSATRVNSGTQLAGSSDIAQSSTNGRISLTIGESVNSPSFTGQVTLNIDSN